MKVKMGDSRKDMLEPFLVVDVRDLKPTTRSRSISGAKEKEMLLGVNLSAS